MKSKIVIRYCTGCRWLLRAAWMAQELLTTFESDLEDVSLAPTDGGRFVIEVDGVFIWDRHLEGGFPEIKVLKQKVRDRIDVDRDLGHIDRHNIQN